jgi:hypothetical protein
LDIALIVELAKERLGIRSAVRDLYIQMIAESVVRELTDEKGIVLLQSDANHLMFCVDYATWRYQSRDDTGALPRHLQYRLHNLMIHSGGQPT